jgi:serine protease inhibitor ecotin
MTDKQKLMELFETFGLKQDINLTKEGSEIWIEEDNGWAWARFRFDPAGKFVSVHMAEL